MARAPRPAKLSRPPGPGPTAWGPVSRRARWCRAGRRSVQQRQPEQAVEAAGGQHRRLRLGRAGADPAGHGHEGGREAGPRQPHRHRRHLGVAGLGDGHHLLALAAVDRGRVGRGQRPGRPGEQVVGLLRLEAGRRTGHPDGVGGPLQGRLLALGRAPVDQREQRRQGDQGQADGELVGGQLPGEDPEGGGRGQGDHADGDDWLRRFDSLLASSGARTRNPPTITFMATSSTTEIGDEAGTGQPRLAAAAQVPAVTGVAASCVVLLPPGLPDGA